MNVTQDNNSSLFDSYNFSVTIIPLNDAPTIDTTFNTLVIQEDNGTTNYELNVSDIEGDDLNITIESNNTAILSVTPNWNNLVNQASWNQTLDFNLTTVTNAHGVVRITIIADDTDKNSMQSFDVNVNPVNDAPVLGTIADLVKDEDFVDFNIALHATDVDDTNLTYNALSNDISKATLSITNNTLTLHSVTNANGVVTIDVNVTDGEYTDTTSFDINITAVDDAPLQQDTNITFVYSSGWSLRALPSKQNINSESFSNVKSLWTYNQTQWSAYIFDEDQMKIIESSNIDVLKSINPTEGFWINAIHSGSLDFNSSSFSLTEEIDFITLDSGWYLFGSSEDLNISTLINLNPNINIIWTYENNIWAAYSPDYQIAKSISSLGYTTIDVIKSSNGFWLNVKQ